MAPKVILGRVTITDPPKKKRNPQDANVKQVGRARANTEKRLMALIRGLQARVDLLEMRAIRQYGVDWDK